LGGQPPSQSDAQAQAQALANTQAQAAAYQQAQDRAAAAMAQQQQQQQRAHEQMQQQQQMQQMQQQQQQQMQQQQMQRQQQEQVFRPSVETLVDPQAPLQPNRAPPQQQFAQSSETLVHPQSLQPQRPREAPSYESFAQAPLQPQRLPNASTVPASFRALPLLSTDLPHTNVNVSHSFVRPNDRGKEVLSFVVYVDPGNNKEGWKVEKMYSDVLALDQRVRNSVGKNVGKKMASLPEGKLWKDHAPAKVDQRKVGHRVSPLYCANVRAGHP
jgi:RalA-binding protein 1